MEEAHSEGQLVPLMGSRLGGVDLDMEKNEDLARVRLQATPRKLFVSTSQPSPSDSRWESRPPFSSPPNPHINLSKTRKNKCIAEFVDRRRHATMDDLETS